MKDQKTIAERIREAIGKNDLDALKALKDEIGRDRWLKQWKARGSNMKDWIEIDNPFVRFVETK